MDSIATMKAFTDPDAIAHFVRRVDEMMTDGSCERDFKPAWLRKLLCKAAETDYSHFGPKEIARIVPTLNQAGYAQCLAVASEPLGPCRRVTRSRFPKRIFAALIENVVCCVIC
jgi:hypothetical protein